MTAVAHLLAFLLCTFAAWATIGAIRRDRDDPPTVRMKLAALIAGPPLLLLTVGVPFTAVIGYYLTGFILIYGLIYGLAFVFTAASYGVGTTLRAVVDLYDTGQRQTPPPEPPTDQHRTEPPDNPLSETERRTDPLRTDEHGRPIIFEDQG